MHIPIIMKLILAILLVAATWAQAEGKGKGKGHGKHDSEVGVFDDGHRRIIRDYVAVMPPSGLPPGLAKRGGDLPPGLERQLRRNGRLPPGLEKKMYAFPVELERRLPPPPADCTRGFIGGRAVIYNRRTSVVLDVFIPL
jgi:hypothetical protein